MKRRNDSKKMCTSSIASEFPEDCKFYPADTKDELHKVSIFSYFFSRLSSVVALNFLNCCLHIIYAVSFQSYLTLFMFPSIMFSSSCGFSRSKGSQFLTGEVNGRTLWLKR